ncbi:MAG: OadG family protein [Lachnospiraceae bacterium]
MVRGKLKKYVATVLVSSALVMSSSFACMAAESETQTAAQTETASETVKESESEKASETETVSESESASGNVSEEAEKVESEISEEESEVSTEAAPQSQEDTFKQAASNLIQQIAALSDEQMDSILEQKDAFTTAAITSWKGVKNDAGAYQSMGEQKVDIKDTTVTITSDVQFEKHTVSVVLTLDMKQGVYTDMSFNIDYTMAEKMEQAGLNTLMGLGIVFCMLAFLSFLISQFKRISGLEAKMNKQPEAPKAPAAPVVPAAAPEPEEEEELAGDEELVAVIAAAVAAYEGSASTDGFVVRSIRKSNNNKWRRA